MKIKLNKTFIILFSLFVVMYTNAYAEDIEMTSDDGLEWNQVKKTITATTNATITRGEMTLKSDKIVAYYRTPTSKVKTKGTVGGDMEIYLIKAEGNVVITSPKEKVNADIIEYDLDKSILSSRPINKPISMTVQDAEVIANGRIDYFELENYAIVNNAQVKHSGRILSADVMVLTFENDTNKNNTGLGLETITATGNLHISDGEDILKGEKAEYNNKTGIATIDGDVELSQSGGSKLKGGKVEYNMNTGIAKMDPNSEYGKVIGIFKSPDKKKN